MTELHKFAISAAHADITADIARVHFLDNERTYFHIDEYVCDHTDVEVQASVGPDGIFQTPSKPGWEGV